MVGTMVQLLDPYTDEIDFRDPNLKMISCQIEGQEYVAYIKLWPQQLLLQMRKLKKYYELIIFTILPQMIVDQIWAMVPELKELISHTLTMSDLLSDD